ncbi:tetratricopeptide repeat protein [Pseudodesulfovibrio sediminis]|uniref:Tetratricopeptide repeat protein n=1 Tax=Pseudodesulfovibrio sediminis TaxID=2810563 RepID=A0ABM7P9Q9_9BACT|nr:tetratricopeptide repeat protein [Pseudodesulfovibrio sediminis]BCS90149.1 hypothetical protein PSDVSF_33910 [Pseudodesulfovibrio sediminis]
MTASTVSFGRKAVILVVIGTVAVMFVTSFLYRMNHPNLFVKGQVSSQPQVEDHDHDGDGTQDHGPDNQAMGEGGAAMGGAMSRVREFMTRVETNPNDVEALIGLGNSFLMMKAWERAIEPLEKAHALEPQNVNVLKGTGIAYFNTEKYEQAAEAYEAILKIDGNDTLALFNLGVINKHYFKKSAVAKTYFEKVLALEKQDAEMIKLARQELEK